MGTPSHRLQQDPPEGSRETINHELKRQESRRGTGAGEAEDRRAKRTDVVNTPAHKLQEDPAEGSRETINNELKRQESRSETKGRG